MVHEKRTISISRELKIIVINQDDWSYRRWWIDSRNANDIAKYANKAKSKEVEKVLHVRNVVHHLTCKKLKKSPQKRANFV